MNTTRLTPVARAAFRAIPQRGMATEQQLKARITGTQNIAKITKSMKMVSAAKLRGDQQRLNAARPFAEWANKLTGGYQDLENIDTASFPDNNLIVAMYTDKGLCGGVNTISSRMIKQMCAKLEASGKKYEIIVLGEKGRSQLNRHFGNKVGIAITERTLPYSFDLSCSLAAMAIEKDCAAVHVVFNKFKSAIQYIPSIKNITPMLDNCAEKLVGTSMIPRKHPEYLLNLYEYTLATHIHHSLLENATAEQSSRMGAMENASKNASEMIEKLTLQYNRARQARITTELIEIISGASALEG
jgi:F-type H+-transporting ATPase subunit gamma